MAGSSQGEGSRMGEIVAAEVDLEIDASSSAGEGIPGLGWTLSEETLDKIREIDANIRAAEQKSGSLIVG